MTREDLIKIVKVVLGTAFFVAAFAMAGTSDYNDKKHEVERAEQIRNYYNY